MKIAITSTDPKIESNVEVRFGRCTYFIIIAPDTIRNEEKDIPMPVRKSHVPIDTYLYKENYDGNKSVINSKQIKLTGYPVSSGIDRSG